MPIIHSDCCLSSVSKTRDGHAVKCKNTVGGRA